MAKFSNELGLIDRPSYLGPFVGIQDFNAGDITADTELDYAARGFYVTSGGEVSVRLLDGTELTISNLTQGVVHPFAVTHVLAATAAAIVFCR